MHDISQRVRLEDSLRRCHAVPEAVNAVTATLIKMSDLDQGLRAVLSHACDALKADGGAIALSDDGQLTLRATQGWRADPVGTRLRAGQGLMGKWPPAVKDSRFRTRFAASAASQHVGIPRRRHSSSCAGPADWTVRRGRRVERVSPCPSSLHVGRFDALSALAGPLGLAVENMRLARRAEERCQELSTLLQVDRAFSAGLELNAVLQVAVNEAVRATGASQGVVFTVNEDADRFEPRVMQGLSERAMRQVQAAPLLLTRGINGRAYRSRQIIRVDDVSSDPDYVVLRRGTRVRSEMVIPLAHGERVLGNIDLGGSRQAAFARCRPFIFARPWPTRPPPPLKTRGCMKRHCAAPKSLAALNAVAATVSQSLDLQVTLDVALDKALEVIGVEAGAISLVDEMAGELVMRVHRGWRHSAHG